MSKNCLEGLKHNFRTFLPVWSMLLFGDRYKTFLSDPASERNLGRLGLGGHFGPEKKLFSPPPPQKNSPIRRRHPPGPSAPPVLENPPPPSWDFQSKNDPLPLLARRTPPSPLPEQKKLKISETSTKWGFAGGTMILSDSYSRSLAADVHCR